MYIHYVKDFENHGHIVGVVVAVATNRVGYAIAHPYAKIDKESKEDILAFAIYRAMIKSMEASDVELRSDTKPMPITPSDMNYNDRRLLMIVAFQRMVAKAKRSKSLPTVVGPIVK